MVFSQLLKNEMGGRYLWYGRYLHTEVPLLGQTSTTKIQDTAFYICAEKHLTFSDSSSICQACLGTCFLTFLQPTHKGFKIWPKRKI